MEVNVTLIKSVGIKIGFRNADIMLANRDVSTETGYKSVLPFLNIPKYYPFSTWDCLPSGIGKKQPTNQNPPQK